ncbi:energy transducer TonB [Fulvivirga sp. RKSG066]|uniref:energy transducer TonB n=1 Tax=Fulvivirga aurantia TaxID=2529383 RepID=UPI0012BC6F3F|nr:energy transducer TonB [Fulvivirga aurantia]MTI21272.1 energy transducer TonB [Fulvivirga aurantia]
MEHRKNLNKDLRRQSGLFFQIGLLIALMICVSAFEYTTKKEYNPVDITLSSETDNWTPPITEIPPPKPPKPKVIPNFVPVEINEPIETPIVDIIIDQTEPIVYEPVIDDIPVEKADDAPFVFVEEMPAPEGGLGAFYSYINKNLKYPSQARRMGIEGKVFVKFVVLENGELDQIHIVRGIGAGCDEEVLRVMDKAPKWNPGKQRGEPVKVWQMVPINFQLD